MTTKMNTTMNDLSKWLDTYGPGMRVAEEGDLATTATHVPKRVVKSSDGTTTMVGGALDIYPDTGEIRIIVPISATKGEAGFARMKSLQIGKRELVRIRLQQKLAARK